MLALFGQGLADAWLMLGFLALFMGFVIGYFVRGWVKE